MSDRHECDGGFPLGHWSVTHRENEISSVAPSSAHVCGLEKSWTGKNKKKKKWRIFFSSKDTRQPESIGRNHQGPNVIVHCLAILTWTEKKREKSSWTTTIDLKKECLIGKIVIDHLLFWKAESKLLLFWLEKNGRKIGKWKCNMSKLYYVIPTILLQGKGRDWKTVLLSSHLFFCHNSTACLISKVFIFAF